MTEEQVIKRVKDAVNRTSYMEVAKEMGVSVSSVRTVVDHNVTPGKMMLKHMGITRVVSYKLEAR